MKSHSKSYIHSISFTCLSLAQSVPIVDEFHIVSSMDMSNSMGGFEWKNEGNATVGGCRLWLCNDDAYAGSACIRPGEYWAR